MTSFFLKKKKNKIKKNYNIIIYIWHYVSSKYFLNVVIINSFIYIYIYVYV